MKNLSAWIVMAACMWLATGCKEKNAQSAIEGAQPLPKTDSISTPPVESGDNAPAPATFHPNKKSKGGKAKHETASHASSSSMSSSTGSGKYVIQVSVFKSKSQAEQFASKLESSDHPAYVAEVESPTPDLSGTYYRVRIGDFASREEADAYGKSKGSDYWVDAKSNDNVGGGSSYNVNAPVPSRPASMPAPGSETSPATPVVAPKKPVHVSVEKETKSKPVSGHVGLDVESSMSPAAPAPVKTPVTPAETMSGAKSTPSHTTTMAPVMAAEKSTKAVVAPAASMTPAAPAKPAVMAPATPAPSRPEPPPVPRDIAGGASGVNVNDPMQSPFQREEYYQPKDSTASASSKMQAAPAGKTSPAANTSADSSSNRRTLPTW